MRKERRSFPEKVFLSLIWRLGLWSNFHSLFWKTVSATDFSTILFKNEVSDLESLQVNNLFSKAAQRSYSSQNKLWQKQDELLCKFTQPVFVEPSGGLILLDSQTVIEESRIHSYKFPDLSVKFKLKSAIEIEAAYYFDGYVGSSYYHFFSEVLSAFFVFKSCNINVPLIVSQKIFDSKLFQYLLLNTDLKRYDIIVQKEVTLKVNHLYLAKGAFSQSYWTGLRLWVTNVQQKNTKNRRVFLNRDRGVGRTIKNEREIFEILHKFGFEILDTESYTVEDQIELMSETQWLIGIHGAGLTNILFLDKGKANVIEINPIFIGEENLRPHYYWLANCLGINYQCLPTEGLDKNDNFHLSASLLEEYLNKLILRNDNV